MAKAKVYNDNVYPYKEKFKGDEIMIPAKGFIEMEEFDAYEFKGSFNSPVLGVDGDHKPEGFKMIRVVKLSDSAEEKDETIKCMACSYRAENAADLNEHSKEHADRVLVDEEAEKATKSKRKGAA